VEVRRAMDDEVKRIEEFDVFQGDRRLDNWRGELLVCVEGGTVLGFVTYSSSLFYNRPFISLLAVREGHRRRGVAAALVGRVLEIYDGLTVWISTEEGNEPKTRIHPEGPHRGPGSRAVGGIFLLSLIGATTADGRITNSAMDRPDVQLFGSMKVARPLNVSPLFKLHSPKRKRPTGNRRSRRPNVSHPSTRLLRRRILHLILGRVFKLLSGNGCPGFQAGVGHGEYRDALLETRAGCGTRLERYRRGIGR